MSTYKALLFDLDNTLIDFSASEVAGLEIVYATYFHRHLSKIEFLQRYHTINQHLWSLVERNQQQVDQVRVARFALLAQQINVSLDSADIAYCYEQAIGQAADWYPGVEASFITLKKKYRLGIITNGLASVQQEKYTRLQLDKFCECYIVSGILGIAKPHKEIFISALSQLNLLAHEVLMIGDSLASDYQGAINAKLDFCWINPRNQTLPLKYPKPKYILRSVKELNQALKNSGSRLDPL